MSEAANVVRGESEEKVGGEDVKGVKRRKEGVNKEVKNPKKVYVGADDSLEDILDWLSKGTEVLFDAGDLPLLKEDELEALPFGVVKRYEAERGKKEKRALRGVSDIETLSGNASTKLFLRERRGWHQTWKRPDEFEDAKRKGYVEIREAKKEGEKPGAETGPVVKIHKEQGVIELIAMEVSQERYDNHVKAVSQRSRAAYAGNKAGFQETVEQVNRNVGKESRVKIIDDEGDIG